MNWTTYIAECVGRDDLIAVRDAACFVLGLSNMTPDAEIDAARNRIHTSITLRADRMSGAPCVGDSRLTIESIANMDRETCRRDFPWMTDEQWLAVREWLETDFGRDMMGDIEEGLRATIRELNNTCDAVTASRDHAQHQRDVAIKKFAEMNGMRYEARQELETVKRELAEKVKLLDRIDGVRANYLDNLISVQHELAATIKAKQENDERFMTERDEARQQLIDMAREHGHAIDRIKIERDTFRREATSARVEAQDAVRLHAAAVEELARVKMPTITADQIELFIWRGGWGAEIKAAGDVSRFAAGLAEHLMGTS